MKFVLLKPLKNISIKIISKHIPRFVIIGSINNDLLHPSVSGDKEIKIKVAFAKSRLFVCFFILNDSNKDEKNPKIDIKVTNPLAPIPLIFDAAIK